MFEKGIKKNIDYNLHQASKTLQSSWQNSPTGKCKGKEKEDGQSDRERKEKSGENRKLKVSKQRLKHLRKNRNTAASSSFSTHISTVLKCENLWSIEEEPTFYYRLF